MNSNTASPGNQRMPPRPAWIEVDLVALAGNLRLVRADLPARVRLMQVIKDDAYGMGSVEVARIALRNGVDAFATFTAS